MIAKLIVTVLLFYRAECIISKASNAIDTKREANKKEDNDAQQSIARGFAYGDEGDYGYHDIGGYGEGYDHYGGNFEPGKYHHGYEDYHKHEHKHDPAYYKALAIKGLLIPLAGVALLGAAAAFVSNPILLQLGVISSAYGRKKREVGRYSTNDDEDSRVRAQNKFREIQLLERFMAQVPKERIRSRGKKLLADYLSCSGETRETSCLERLACELHSKEGASMPIETNVMAIITNEIFDNEFVPENFKSRIEKAARRGSSDDDCSMYACKELALMANDEKGNSVKGRGREGGERERERERDVGRNKSAALS